MHREKRGAKTVDAQPDSPAKGFADQRLDILGCAAPTVFPERFASMSHLLRGAASTPSDRFSSALFLLPAGTHRIISAGIIAIWVQGCQPFA